MSERKEENKEKQEEATKTDETLKDIKEEAKRVKEEQSQKHKEETEEIEKQHAKNQAKKNTFTLKSMTKRQSKRLWISIIAVVIGALAIIVPASFYLCDSKEASKATWNEYKEGYTPSELTDEKFEKFTKDATKVKVAIGLEQITDIDLKNSKFSVVCYVGYRWNGDAKYDFSLPETVHFYKGVISAHQLMEESHEDGVNYQKVRYKISMNHGFSTARFPLESHTLRIFLEPSENISTLVFEPAGVGKGSYRINSMDVSGYEVKDYSVSRFCYYTDEHLLNPKYDKYTEDNKIYRTEICAQALINRDGFGLYLKCMIAMFGTLIWILLCLYIATFRKINPIGMVGSAFFGAVSNIMVGANLLPDALEIGLVEFMNIFGIAAILAGTAIVISINTIRTEYNHDNFATFYGRVMLGVFAVLVVCGNIVLPVIAY